MLRTGDAQDSLRRIDPKGIADYADFADFVATEGRENTENKDRFLKSAYGGLV